MLTRNGLKKRKGALVAATRIGNFIKNDMIIDYLDLINENKLTLDANLELKRKRSSSSGDIDFVNKKKKSSLDYIFESGYVFENDIINQIENMMFNNNEKNKIANITEKNIDLNYSQTINTIVENKHSIILGGVLINDKNNTWGKPDIIVKGEWIQKYIANTIEQLCLNKWYIIDIKSSTINLINKGEEMSSKLLYNVYKSQIYIYTQALNESLKKINIDNNVHYGFILGKKYKYIVNKNTITKKPFEYLGIVNFNKDLSNGNCWEKTITDALNWHNDLKNNWTNFKLNPINKDELYPNMKNSYDKNWHSIKKDIAYKNKEITLLWNCGIANRKLAWDNGIKNYSDPKLNSQILGFNGNAKEIIIDSMLNLLHSDNKFILNKSNNLMGWQQKSQWEFFIDFETYNNDAIYDEESDWNNSFNNQVIYMIGLSYFDSSNNLIHKSFLLEYKNCHQLSNEFVSNTNFDNVKYNDCIFCTSEIDMINKFYNFIIKFKPEQTDIEMFKKNTRLYHWSGAEQIIFNKKIQEYNLDVKKFNLNWFDLLKVFKHDKYPIVIKECFGFGLKEIIKKLNNYGLINLSWSDLDDGLLSSFIARDIYTGINLKHNNDMYFIIEYNYIDCKALHLLLEWMRKEVTK